ncbi:TIR domain-containing protein [Amycolatopsis sp. NPDC049688]|uniref:TIR domain-containing protein n=1 Tax=Amycolatopsis sp. NPDC049688 TaxID=3154733 RepID=UPI00341521D2
MERGKTVDAIGPTGQRLAKRVAELRQAAGLTQADLAGRMTELGRPTLLSAVSRIEKGQRRVDADDLVALALALNVAPNYLLLPTTPDADLVQLTRSTELTIGSAWRWAAQEPPSFASNREGYFISYSNRDGFANAKWLAEILRSAGHKVWFDAWELKVGDNIAARIRDAIESADAVVVVLSEDYASRPWMSREISIAAAQPNPRFLPVRFEEVEAPGLLGDYKYLDLFELEEVEAKRQVLEVFESVSRATEPRSS